MYHPVKFGSNIYPPSFILKALPSVVERDYDTVLIIVKY